MHLHYITIDVVFYWVVHCSLKLHLYIAAIWVCNNGRLMKYYDKGRILNQKKINALQISFERLYPKLKQNWCFQLHNVTGSFSWYCYFDDNSIIIVCMIYSMAYFCINGTFYIVQSFDRSIYTKVLMFISYLYLDMISFTIIEY